MKGKYWLWLLSLILLSIPLQAGAQSALNNDIVAAAREAEPAGVSSECGGMWESGSACTFQCSTGDTIIISGQADPNPDSASEVHVLASCGGVIVECQKQGDIFEEVTCEARSDQPASTDDMEGSCSVEGNPGGAYSCRSSS